MVPLVSIIIPTYNRAHVISGALNSLLYQQYPHTEIIVVDDGSRDTDALVGVIRDFRRRFAGELTLVHRKNTGPGGARAHGLRLSKGHYIQYLDSDDVLLPGAIKRHVTALEAHPNAAVAYGITLEEQPDGTRVERMFARDYVPDLLEATLQWRRWNTSNPLWHYPGDDWRARKWWSDAATNEDFVHDVRVACMNQRMVFIPEPAMLYRILTGDRRSTKRGQSITKARFLPMMEVRQAIEDAGLMHQPRYALFFAERCLFEAVQAGKYGCWKEIFSLQIGRWPIFQVRC